jgi:hypothetical protein
MCLIDKVATKQWRQVWTIVSKTTKQVHAKAWDQVYLEANSREKLFAVMPPAEETFRVVFLRDPLERFLSAFLDKCVGVNNRREGYCWPKRVYYNENDSDENDYTTRGLTPQQQFAQFVSVMPLQWNIQFAPMGLSCNGLYRNLNEYDFVGLMGKDFNAERFSDNGETIWR